VSDITEQLFPMMESVVSTDGTAVKAAIPGYRVAGKQVQRINLNMGVILRISTWLCLLVLPCESS